MSSLPVPLPVSRALSRLGDDLSRARRRRRLSQASFAQRSGISVATLRRMERGDLGGVRLEYLARAIHVLGEIDRLEHLLETGEDPVGLMLMDQDLPKRVRTRKGSGALRERGWSGSRHRYASARPRSRSAISPTFATGGASTPASVTARAGSRIAVDSRSRRTSPLIDRVSLAGRPRRTIRRFLTLSRTPSRMRGAGASSAAHTRGAGGKTRRCRHSLDSTT